MRRFILERYLIREALQNFLAVIAVLVLIYMSNRFVRFLAEAAAGELDSGVILELLLLKITANSVVLLPLALYLGILLGLGRLYRDSEIVAMHAGGLSNMHVVRAIGVMALVFAVGVAGMSMYVAPLAADNAEALTRQARDDSEVTGLYPGRFKDFGDGEHIIFVGDSSADRGQLSDVFVQMRTERGIDLVYAESASQFVESRTGDRFMVLVNGYRYEGSPGEVDYAIHAFARHGVRIKQKVDEEVRRRMETMSTDELLDGGTERHVAELQWRVSMPVSAVLLAVLAVPLARTSPRGGKYGKLFTAVLIYFLYSNCLSIAQKSVERGDLDAVIGVWPVHLVLLAGAATMLFITSGGVARIRAARVDGA